MIRGLNFKIKSKGVNELQFQIRGKEYFLAFVEDEKRWYVFAPTADGMQRMPVYVDAVKYESQECWKKERTIFQADIAQKRGGADETC